MKNKIAISLLSLKKRKNLDKFLSILKKNEVHYVELPILKIFNSYNPKKMHLENFNKKLKKNSIKVSSIQAIFYGREDLNIFRDNDTKKILNHLKKVIKLAKYFGASNLIFGSPQSRFLLKKNKKEQINNGIKLFKKIGKLCGKKKIYFCIEPNAKHYSCNYNNYECYYYCYYYYYYYYDYHHCHDYY